jgi:hypothetical protein
VVIVLRSGPWLRCISIGARTHDQLPCIIAHSRELGIRESSKRGRRRIADNQLVVDPEALYQSYISTPNIIQCSLFLCSFSLFLFLICRDLEASRD